MLDNTTHFHTVSLSKCLIARPISIPCIYQNAW